MMFAMPFHGLYNSRRATPPQPSAADVWGELVRRYVKPELNAKSSPEEVWRGILFLRKMGYSVVDTDVASTVADVTPADLGEIMAVVGRPRPVKKKPKDPVAEKPKDEKKDAKPKEKGKDKPVKADVRPQAKEPPPKEKAKAK